MARESTEIKTINNTRGSRTTNNFSIVGTSNEIDVATSAGTGNNPGYCSDWHKQQLQRRRWR